MKIQSLTMGCSKNRVDTEHILRQLELNGWEISPENYSLKDGDVDVLLINTCGFIEDAKVESIETILEALEYKKAGYISKVVVMGCLSERYMDELKESIPEVDAYLGAYDLEDTLKVFKAELDKSKLTERYLTTPSHYAFLKISEGCDRHCSYCAIPGIRGPQVSISMEDLLIEAKNLIKAGAKELIVIAQDTTYYGVDLYGKKMLGTLLAKLDKLEGVEWIRIHYSYPQSFPEDVLDIMNTSKKIVKYMDIPLQHSSTPVLKAMRRHIDEEGTRAIVQKMREKVPGIVIRTTMMVGHPGETRADFENLLQFVKDNRFERLGAFTYSEEEGTWGAKNLEDNIPQDVKDSRYEELMEVQSDISSEFNLSRIGSIEKVLIDSYNDNMYYGRTSKESPEVDGEVLIESDDNGKLVGTFQKVKIVGADEYDLFGKFY
ncbi:MAG: 30S ribosomal protein S12 methylthiotransferase RimO [Bacteroidales bacterium]